MLRPLRRLILFSAVAFPSWNGAAGDPIQPPAPKVGLLFDESYTIDGVTSFGAVINDSFSTMDGLTAKGTPTAVTTGAGGPSTSADTPFAYTGNTSFSTIGGPATGNPNIWHGTFGVGAYRALFSGAPAVTVSGWVKYAEGALTAAGAATSAGNNINNNANAFLAMTVDGACGGCGLYLNLPTGVDNFTTPTVQYKNKLLVGGDSGGGFHQLITTTQLIPDAWNHVVGVLDFANSEIRVSINAGAFESVATTFSSGTLTPGATGTNPDTIPVRSPNSEYIGLLDEFAIWPTALSIENVQWLRNNSVTLLAAPPTGDGDYNEDGTVNAADYVLWRKDRPGHGGAPGGYNLWRTNFGAPSGSGSGLETTAVPEPSSIVVALLGAYLLLGFRRS